ncbi:2-keto-4-pentenoate hydratase [Pseudochelatococcus lubricantis]|uniref:2-keto-4-pentenoate hydratase n=1 Tax=Pseudochelatococcus lubricantis TaxID=1538102 RepID=A0ABX0UV91_9HYPH|nr:fumarylacetoacetate hydrolase family protein [Pseudochelatococcus lubricantis]NIJ56882.1 2-keto-4-pentenoate hydratase [Pseudochelatococcus lubricantis]
MVETFTPESVEAAAERLLAARNGGPRVVDLPPALRPTDWETAYAVQDALITRLGPVVGWKVGAADPQSEPFRAALTSQTVSLSPASVAHAGHAVLGVEAETVYRFDRALPPRERPYTEDEVLAAVGSIHAAIELVDTHFAVWGRATRLSQIADQFNHAHLIVGSGREAGAIVDALNQPVRLRVNGEIVLDQRGGNAAGPSARLLAWLANGGATSLGGLKEGTYVTTGSWTGITFVAPRSHVEVTFEGIGSVVVDITE